MLASVIVAMALPLSTTSSPEEAGGATSFGLGGEGVLWGEGVFRGEGVFWGEGVGVLLAYITVLSAGVLSKSSRGVGDSGVPRGVPGTYIGAIICLLTSLPVGRGDGLLMAVLFTDDFLLAGLLILMGMSPMSLIFSPSPPP